METVKLELEKLQILRPKERWRLYFVLVTEHPAEKDKMVITSFPDPYIRLKPSQNNVINFEPIGSGADGLTVMERELPADRMITTRLYLRQSHQPTRNIGKILQDIKGELGGDAMNIVSNILGTTSPWLVIAKEAIPLIGGILRNIKDRDFGFVNLDEEFGSEFSNQGEIDRENTFSTGEAKICWSWSLK
jgi:hypothetical protein